MGAARGGVRRGAASGGGKRRRDDRGATAVEFAGIIPFLGLALLIVWQIIIIGLTSMYASHAANEASRTAAVIGTSDKWCHDPDGKRVICQTWDSVRKEAVKRIAKPFYDKDHFDMKLTGGYATVSIDTPAVLPEFHTPWSIGASAKIVDETGDGGGGVSP